MTRLLPVLLSLALASCVSTAKSVPEKEAAENLKWFRGRHLDVPLTRVLNEPRAASLATAGRALSALTLEQPLLVPLIYHGQERYQLVEEYEILGQQIPKGLIVDGASVPRGCWIFMPPDGVHRAGALFHDWAYQNSGRLTGWTLTRHDADTCLKNLMLDAGVSPTRAGIVYDAVRLFGGSSWGAHKPIIEPVERRMFAAAIVKPRNLFSHIYAQ